MVIIYSIQFKYDQNLIDEKLNYSQNLINKKLDYNHNYKTTKAKVWRQYIELKLTKENQTIVGA
jgi:hypothetical protein